MYKFIKKKNVYEQIHKYHRGDRSNDGEFEVKQARERKNKKKKNKKKREREERWWKSDGYPPWKYACGARDRGENTSGVSCPDETLMSVNYL